MSNLFHTMTVDGELPEHLNNPFDYEPHPLCRDAVGRVCDHLAERKDWADEVASGKMFGVLVYEGGYLAAFSAKLDG